jgi:hypothetical protein
VGAIVRQVDHILIESNRAEELFALLAEALALPVTWPFQRHEGFTSGAVSGGNINIEVLEPFHPPLPAAARLTGIAFEPAPLDEAISELDGRGLSHSKRVPYLVPGAPDSPPLWTWVLFPNWGDGEVFLCDYRPDISSVASRRAALDAIEGGTLGLRGVQEIAIGAADFEAAVEHWEKLLSPAQNPERGVWQPGDGPALRLVRDQRDTLLSVTLRVASLGRAREVLKSLEYAGEESEGRVTLTGQLTEGLELQIVE